MRYQYLRKVRAGLIAGSALPFLTACAIGQMGNCGAFCDKGTMVRSEAGIPPQNPAMGQLLGLGHPKNGEHWIWSRRSIERVAELPQHGKTDPLRNGISIPAESRQGKNTFTFTWGRGEIDSKTRLEKDIPTMPPAAPPGLYRLTSQVSFIDKGQFNKYLPFQGKPRTTTISVEAGKTTVLSYRTGVDTSTTPITAWVDVVQLGSAEALPLMYKNPNYRVSPNIQIAEPPASSATH